MAKQGEKFIMGIAKSLGGSMRARVQEMIDFDRQQKEEQAQERQARLDAMNKKYQEAQIRNLDEVKAQTPKSKDQYLADLLQNDPEKYYEILSREEGIKAKYSGKEDKRPEDTTGIGEVVPLIKKRKTDREGQISDWEKNFEKNTGIDYPTWSQITAETNHPTTISSKLYDLGFSQKDAAGNHIPYDENSMAQIFANAKRMTPRPEPYKIPTGDAFAALKDSVETARTDPNVAAELLDVQPGGLQTVAPQVQAPAQPFTPEQAAFTPDMNDPEIQKAYQALKSGQITQEIFDDFAKQRMGQ